MRHKENILRLRAEGKSYRYIQKELGCSKATIAYHCGEGQKEKTKERTQRVRRQTAYKIREYKESRGCMDCGEKYPHWMLDFDHLPGYDKVGSPIQVASTYNIEAGWDEVAKCEVVCANCHRIRTHVRGQNEFKTK